VGMGLRKEEEGKSSHHRLGGEQKPRKKGEDGFPFRKKHISTISTERGEKKEGRGKAEIAFS